MICVQSEYDYLVEIRCVEGALIKTLPLQVQWEPAHEWTFWQGLRAGRFSREDRAHMSERPIFETQQPLTAGQIRGFQVFSLAHGPEHFACSFPTNYFAQGVMRAAGQVTPARAGIYGLVKAVPVSKAARGKGPTVNVTYKLPEIRADLSRRDLRLCHYWGPQDDISMPLFIKREIITLIQGYAHAAGELETGGFLIGHVCRDPQDQELFLLVDSQVRACHTTATVTSLHFAPATWQALEKVLGKEQSQGHCLGWWHSHNFTPEAPQEKHDDPFIMYTTAFFSMQDRYVHRTAFWGGTNVALVLGKTRATPQSPVIPDIKAYGWSHGLILERGFWEVS